MNMLKKILSYLLSDALNKLFPFLSVFFIAKFLTAADTGIYSLYILYYTFIYSMILMGISSKVMILMSKAEYNEKLILTSAYITCLINFLIILIVIKIADINLKLDQTIYTILFCALFFAIGQIKIISYRVKENIISFASVNLFFSGLLFIAICICLKFNIELKFVWKILIFPYALVGFWFVKKDFYFIFNEIVKEINSYIKFGVGQIIHILSSWGRVAIDKICVLFMINITVVGYYSMIMSLSLIVSMFSQSLNNYFSVYLFKMLSIGNYRKCIISSIIFSISIICFSLLFVFICRYFIIFYLPVEYLKYYYLLPIIICGFCFQGFYLSIVNYIFYIDKSYLLNIPSLISITVMFVSSVILIYFFGVVGAALALFFSWFIQFILILKLIIRYKDEIFV
ncbi:lipopolysaccharide biosynthesis protein [Photobacterium phosphoreum]|uniref:lipopolysaccharide biosynthesis protein n=1 Tax=Photobacterium phosphoreum TaxID=659 RepID=UPI000D15EAB4|nr:oligosaccharide flippase family protein [Photobacterium phosphoreum]PTB31261.1 hypothetical protein DAT36_17970 [Photobacterium phosphoreum]